MADEPKQIADAFDEYDRQNAIRKIRTGVYLAIVLLPAGAAVDFFLYRGHLLPFLKGRCFGSLAMIPLLLVVGTHWGSKYHRVIGVAMAMVPAVVMAWLCSQTGGAVSPYYAGLNLVLLTVGLVLQWNTIQSLVATLLVVVMFFGVALGVGVDALGFGIFVNNAFFLLLTGVIVVIGNDMQTKLRFKEFESRHQLNESRQELERTNNRLREMDELKGRFFANISHELRTPLTLLISPLEALKSHLGKGGNDRVQEWLDTMQANSMRLLKLINDLLDLVRLDTGKLKLNTTSIDVGEFVRGMINSVKRVAEEKGLKLESDIAPEIQDVKADLDKLEKIFLNLLFNSIKFTSAGGKVRIVAAKVDPWVEFRIEDTGVGITRDHLPYVFDRFWQADSSSQRKFQGAGIGLALVKELVQAHHGTVVAQSKAGEGTTIVVRLPIQQDAATRETIAKEHHARSQGNLQSQPKGIVPELPVPAPAPAPAPATPAESIAAAADKDDANWLANLYRRAEMFPGLHPLRQPVRPVNYLAAGQKPRLLIVDDEPDMLRFLRSLMMDDFDVLEAVDGAQAVTMAAQFLPDGIVCDMMLPELDGLQVCRELRGREGTRHIPFLMLTARADDETKLETLGSGATDFLSKPFSAAELRLRVGNMVESRQLQQRLAWQKQKLEATIEQLKDTELQLVQSEKLASLGRMSAGIIHEINNPLNYARTGLYTLQRKSGLLPAEDREEFDDVLKDISEGITRVSTIVADLRSFTHPREGLLEEVDLADCIQASLRFLAAEWKEKIALEQELSPGFVVRANRNKVIQVTTNLLQNAFDAVRSKTFADGSVPLVRIKSELRGKGRALLVWDNGSGISQEHLMKIFDPFFTTKDVGRGTGLGLSICYRIMSDFGGRISAQSEKGVFTEFTLEFPDPEDPELHLEMKATA